MEAGCPWASSVRIDALRHALHPGCSKTIPSYHWYYRYRSVSDSAFVGVGPSGELSRTGSYRMVDVKDEIGQGT